ncbi:hypothetical protein PF008_g33484, partial [Phytophthora fragariae]
MQDKGFTRGYIGVGKESGSAREQPPGAQRGFPEDGDGLARGGPRFVQEFVESSASEDDMNQDSGTDNGETSSELALVSSAAIHLDTLEFPQGVSLGMFASQAEHLAGSEPHAAVFKLRYTLRIRSQPK